MATFNAERRVFDRLRADCSDEVRTQYENAIRVLLERYNTTIYENRFVVGGAVEVFTCAILRSVGIDCTLYSSQEAKGDILLPGGKQVSIKGSFTGKRQGVILMNKRGGGTREWDTATLFVVSNVGIVYGTPAMVGPDDVKDVGDSLVLRYPGLASLIADPANVIPMDIAVKQPTEMTGFSHKASAAVARQVLFETKADALLSAFPT
ncbi:MAG: hypothetical protein F4003_04290 [Acidimicrobiaceae bacterium]|nr:hypothetical protein [Acidimicrobiaceae bacterium]